MKKIFPIILSLCVFTSIMLSINCKSYANEPEKGTEENPYKISEIAVDDPINGVMVCFENDTEYTIYAYEQSTTACGLWTFTTVKGETAPKQTLAPGEKKVWYFMGINKVYALNLTPPAPAGNQNYIAPLMDNLNKILSEEKETPSDEPTVVTWNLGDSLPLETMKALSKTTNTSLLFSFEYDGVAHTVMIPAGEAFVDEDIPWYGPLWLLGKYGEYDPSAKEYEVKAGDSLNAIAKKNGLTLDELIKKNPQIKNINLIRPGDIINI